MTLLFATSYLTSRLQHRNFYAWVHALILIKAATVIFKVVCDSIQYHSIDKYVCISSENVDHLTAYIRYTTRRQYTLQNNNLYQILN